MATLDLRDMAAATADVPAPVVEAPKLVGRQTKFTVEYIDPSTQAVQSAQLTANIPTMQDKAAIGRKQAYLAGKFKYDDMPADWQLWAEAYANVSTRLVNAPAWLLEAIELDNGLLDALWGRLLEHEHDYFRADSAASDGATGKPRVVLS